MHIYYLLEKQTAVQPVSIIKNHSTEQKLHDKKGSRVKKITLSKNHSEFTMKNVPCVHGTIEITLERIKCDIVSNWRRQKRSEFALCVS